MSLRAIIVLSAIVIAGLLGAFFALPQHRELLFGEAGFVQSASALFFLAAFLTGVGTWIAHRGSRTLLLPVGTAFSLLCFLDETGLGTQMFERQTPPVWTDGHIDSLHNVGLLLLRFAREYPVMLFGAIFMLAMVALFYVMVWRQKRFRDVVRPWLQDPGCLLFGLCLLLLGGAAVIDTQAGPLRKFWALEELAEMAAGLLLWVSLLSRALPSVARYLRRLQGEAQDILHPSARH